MTKFDAIPRPEPDWDSDDTASELLNAWVEEVQDYAIFLLDVSGNVVSWNRGAERILGYSESEILGHPLSMFFAEDDIASGVPELEITTALSRGRANDDRWHVRKNGSRFWCSGLLTRLGNSPEEARGFVKVMRDLTREKQIEQQLRMKTDQLVEADRKKNEFLAMLSHELRNPLSAIVTSFHIIRDRDTSDDPIVRQSWATVDRQFFHLRKLLDGLLDVSRIALNKIELHQELTDVSEIVRRSVDDVAGQLEQARLMLKLSIASEPIPVNGDGVRLGQVFTNLLINAIKFTDPGGTVELSTIRDRNEAVIRVTDSGIGISPEMLGQIFDLFSQAEQGLDRSRGGLGIGLTLARRLVELHGGTLISRSQGVGRGSEFEVRLPIAPEGEIATHPDAVLIESGFKPRSLRILIADDNRDAAESLSICVRHAGHEVTIVHDGQSALDFARVNPLDVVILDIGLPRMDGYAVAKQIRQQSKVVLIAISGYARDENADVEFDHYLIKPAQPDDLLALLSRVTPREAGQPESNMNAIKDA
jgi:PAS domain S-box-containing protein